MRVTQTIISENQQDCYIIHLFSFNSFYMSTFGIHWTNLYRRVQLFIFRSVQCLLCLQGKRVNLKSICLRFLETISYTSKRKSISPDIKKRWESALQNTTCQFKQFQAPPFNDHFLHFQRKKLSSDIPSTSLLSIDVDIYTVLNFCSKSYVPAGTISVLNAEDDNDNAPVPSWKAFIYYLKENIFFFSPSGSPTLSNKFYC